MQNVSSAYRNAIRRHYSPYDEVYGTVTFDDNSTLSVSRSNIVEKQFKWSRQCVSEDELEFGGVFSGLVEMQIYDTETSRYAFYGAKLTLDYKINVSVTSTPSYEVVHIGVFTISEADREGSIIKVKAYDDMRKLDTGLPSTAFQGTPYQVLNLISNHTGYQLSFTEQDLVNFPNSTLNMYIDSTSGIKTCRDAVKIVCQALGCFAEDNRQGKMEVRRFSKVSDITLTLADWYTAVIADYTCNYVGLSVTGEQGTFTSVLSTETVGNIMTIPDAPAWDYGTELTLQNQTDALFAYLKTLAYTPSEIDTFGDPSYDCGDRITLDTDTDDVETLVTSFEWRWDDGMTIVSNGTNPYLTGESTSEIASTRLLQKNTQNSAFTYYTYTNSAQIVVDDVQPRKLVDITFGVAETTTVTLWHEFNWINAFTGSEQEITLTYYLDGVEQNYYPIHTYGEEGKHNWGTQYWLADIEAGSAHTWQVWAETNSGTATIPVENLHALLQGQRLTGEIKWNGEIKIPQDSEMPDEFHAYVPHNAFATFVDGFEDSDLVVTDIFPKPSGADTISVFEPHNSIVSLTDKMWLNTKFSTERKLITESGQYNLISEEGKRFRTEEGD